MPRLFLSNIPYDCQDTELRRWIETQGFHVDSVRVVRDLVTGMSPAFGYISLQSTGGHLDPIGVLNGQSLRGRTIQVKEDWRFKRWGNLNQEYNCK